MKNALVLSEKSLQQIEKSADWFFQQKPGLAIKFLNELNKEFEFIQKHPLKSQVRYKNVRIKFLKIFDFGIHYLFENKTIFVLYVFHTSQSDDNWF